MCCCIPLLQLSPCSWVPESRHRCLMEVLFCEEMGANCVLIPGLIWLGLNAVWWVRKASVKPSRIGFLVSDWSKSAGFCLFILFCFGKIYRKYISLSKLHFKNLCLDITSSKCEQWTDRPHSICHWGTYSAWVGFFCCQFSLLSLNRIHAAFAMGSGALGSAWFHCLVEERGAGAEAMGVLCGWLKLSHEMLHWAASAL